MAMDFTKPSTADNYSTQFVPNIIANFTAVAAMLDSSLISITGTPPTGTKRYNGTSSAMEQWNGSAWVVIPFHGLTYLSGSIGIGGSPAGGSKLYVLGAGGNTLRLDSTSSTEPYLGVYSSAGATALGFIGGAASLVIGASAGDFAVRGESHILLSIGGTETGRLTTTGLYLGGTAGARNLNVNGGANPSMVVKSSVASGGAGTSAYYFGNSASDTAGAVNYDHAGNFMSFGVNGGVERMRIDSAGNVLVGVTSGTKLSVAVNTAIADGLTIINNSNSGYLTLMPNGNTGAVGSWAASTVLEAVPAGSGGLILSAFSGNMIFQTNARTERMRLDSSGNLGIGGTAAGGRLYVLGTGNATVRLDSSTTTPPYLAFYASSSATPVGFVGGATGIVTGGGNTDICLRSQGQIMFADASGNLKFQMTSDGRLYGTALHNNAGSISGTTNQYIASGNWVPTYGSFTNVTGVVNPSGGVHRFTRVGNVVTASGAIQVQSTSSGVTVFNQAIPVPSNMVVVGHLAGTFSSGTSAVSNGVVYGDPSGDAATFQYTAASGTTVIIYYMYQYEVL